MFFTKWKFHRAAKKGTLKKVATLLRAGIDPNLQDKNGRTALHLAIETGCSSDGGNHLEVIKLLLEKGSNIEAQDKEGQTALHWANKSGYSKVAELLIKIKSK